MVICGPKDTLILPKVSLGLLLYKQLQLNAINKVLFISSGSDSNVEHTSADLQQNSVALAKYLLRTGLEKNDTISIISQNNYETIVIILACLYIGVTVNLLNYDYTPAELQHSIAICNPKLLFASDKSIENVIETQFPFEQIIGIDCESFAVTQISNLISTSRGIDDFSPVDLNPDEDVAFILCSSGTTGLPKAVMLTHSNLRITLLYTRDPNLLNFNDTLSMIGYLPFFHIFGVILTLASIQHSCKTIILEKFHPEIFLKAIEVNRIRLLFVVPPIVLFLVKSPLIKKYDLSSLKDLISGAAPVTRDLEELVRKTFPGVNFRQMYGLTEVTGCALITPMNESRIGSIGKPSTTHEIIVCDNDGNCLGPNAIGEIRIRGSGVMKGYLNNEKESADIIDSQGFLKSGDVGYYDNDEYFYVVDRLKELIKYKGFQVAPAELEGLLMKHEKIVDAGVIGIPDEKAGELPKAFVVKAYNVDVTEEEIKQYVADNLSLQKRLYGGVQFVSEIPKNPSGKILRKKLKELYCGSLKNST